MNAIETALRRLRDGVVDLRRYVDGRFRPLVDGLNAETARVDALEDRVRDLEVWKEQQG